MLNLFSLKDGKKDTDGGGGHQTATGKKRASAAQIRITKDLNELELPKTCGTDFPDPDDLLNFKLIISPDEGFYRTGRFTFSFKIGHSDALAAAMSARSSNYIKSCVSFMIAGLTTQRG